MSDAAPASPKIAPRQLACARCGQPFACNLHGPCWCGEVAAKFPLPKQGGVTATGFDDCLCRDCLIAIADEHARNQTT